MATDLSATPGLSEDSWASRSDGSRLALNTLSHPVRVVQRVT